MAIQEKITQDELILYDILKHPVLCTEFIYNLDKIEQEEEFEFHEYQKEMLCDFNSYVSICSSRAVGKTVTLVAIMIWILVNNLFQEDYIVYLVPNKSQLEPVWTGLIREFRSNSFLKNFLEQKKGINSSNHTISLLNTATLLCRIAGTSGTGANVIGLHTPFEIIDECIVGTQKVLGKNTNTRASSLSVGDTVLSWNGKDIEEDRIKSIKKIERNQKVLEIGFADNKLIRVGENHRIYTENGYKEAKELSTDDNIFLYDGTTSRFWEQEELDEVFSSVENGMEVKEVAKNLNRSELSVFRKIDSLGLSVKEIFDSNKMSERQKQIITGSLLGDGSVYRYKYRSAFTANHSYKQKEYVDWLYSELESICRKKPSYLNNGGWGTVNYRLYTLGRKEILDLCDILYVDNKKTVTLDYLNRLDELGLAVWFMDDGSYGTLSTHSFTKEENELISKWFKDRWDIKTTVKQYKNRDLYYIQINSMAKFASIIKEYIHPTMIYKIDCTKKSNYNQELPQDVTIDENTDSLRKLPVLYIREVNTRSKYLYSIEVERNHNFFVNGILTKNSAYFPFPTWLELQPTLNTWTSGFRQMVSGVPTGLREQNVLYTADMENDNFTKHRISSYKNPRFTEEDEERAIQQYGGKDSEDFAHMVLGKHGSPIFSVFDRRLFEIKQYEVYKISINGLKVEGIQDYIKTVSMIPSLPKDNNGCIIGIDLGYCYSEDTDVLTKRGWVQHKDVTEEDTIACFDTEKNSIVWDKPIWIWKQDYKGKMLEVNGKSTNFCVSPEHKIWANKSKSGSYEGYKELKAKNILDFGSNRFKVKTIKNSIENENTDKVCLLKIIDDELDLKSNVTEIDYEGKIYCLKTTTGFYITRRKGKIAIQGNTEPSAILIMYIDTKGKFRFHARIQLTKVSYNLQDRIIDMLDTKFSPGLIGVDEGSSGKAVTQRLMESVDFANKNYSKRLIPVNFSTVLTIGQDSDGKEIKSRIKPFSVSILQDYVNSHRIVFSSTDPELMSELERMTYSKNVNGDISYKTLTHRGGKKGEDHFTAALLCGTLAYYLEYESFVNKVVKPKLFKSRWIL